MIHIEKPYGAISEKCVAKKVKNKNGYFIIDNLGNRWEISEKDFERLEVEEIGNTNRRT